MKLLPKEENHYTMVVRLPADADIGSFSNCASVKKARSDDDGANSCHTVQTKPAETPPEPKQCKGGMILLPEGECACPPGMTWIGRSCSVTPPVDDVCPRSRPNGEFPHCCPKDHHFDPTVRAPRGACVPDSGSGTGGATGIQQQTEPPPPQGPPPTTTGVCEGRYPVGTHPNCCPRNHHFDPRVGAPRGSCVSDPRKGGPGDSGTQGTKPDGGSGSGPQCPSGTHFARTAKHPRGACVVDDKKGGPGDSGTQGTKPDGGSGSGPQCPSGTHFARTAKHPRGACVVDDKKGGPGDSGTQGTKPDGGSGSGPQCPSGTHFARTAKHPRGACVSDDKKGGPGDGGTQGTKPPCPPGTHATRSGQCEQNASPSSKPTPTPSTSTGKCTGGRVGTPPNCFCPPPKKFIGRRCRLISKPTPTPSGPSPTPKSCPPGMKGPKCDQIIVH